jgi:hypothetical protein
MHLLSLLLRDGSLELICIIIGGNNKNDYARSDR